MYTIKVFTELLGQDRLHHFSFNMHVKSTSFVWHSYYLLAVLSAKHHLGFLYIKSCGNVLEHRHYPNSMVLNKTYREKRANKMDRQNDHASKECLFFLIDYQLEKAAWNFKSALKQYVANMPISIANMLYGNKEVKGVHQDKNIEIFFKYFLS